MRQFNFAQNCLRIEVERKGRVARVSLQELENHKGMQKKSKHTQETFCYRLRVSAGREWKTESIKIAEKEKRREMLTINQ